MLLIGAHFNTRVTMVCGGLITSARARLHMGYIWRAFFRTLDRSGYVFLWRATRHRRGLYEVHGVYQ